MWLDFKWYFGGKNTNIKKDCIARVLIALKPVRQVNLHEWNMKQSKVDRHEVNEGTPVKNHDFLSKSCFTRTFRFR